MGRTLSQQMSDAHEADIAEWTGGKVQKASGSQWQNQGDTKNGEYLVPYPITSDGKSTMGASISVSRAMWNKLVAQTFGQTPALFLRFYAPGETVRNVDLDLAVVRSGFFVEILEAARKWAAVEEEIAHEGELEAEYVVELLRMAKGAFPALTPRVDEEQIYMGGHKTGNGVGCDCCR